MRDIKDANGKVIFSYDPQIQVFGNALREHIRTNSNCEVNNLILDSEVIENNSFITVQGTKLISRFSHFKNVTFRNLNLRECEFRGSVFKYCNFEDIWFDNAILDYCTFDACIFLNNNFRFHNTNIVGLQEINQGSQLMQLWQKDNISQGGTTTVSSPSTNKITASQIQNRRFATSENLTISKNADGSFNTWKLESATSDQILEYAYDLVYKRDAKNPNVGINKLREAWQKLNPNQKLPLLLK